MNFTEMLVEKGYKTYKFIGKNDWNKDAKRQAQKILDENPEGIVFKKGDFNSNESTFYVPCGFNHIYTHANFNCMQNGGIAVFFVKDNDFNKPFIFGLNEHGEPPTLIMPRPNIRYRFFNEKLNQNDCYNESRDIAMNYCLNNETPIDILNAIGTDIIFKYDTTKNP